MLERLRDTIATTSPSEVLREMIREIGYEEYVQAQEDRKNDEADDDEPSTAAADLELVRQVGLHAPGLGLGFGLGSGLGLG